MRLANFETLACESIKVRLDNVFVYLIDQIDVIHEVIRTEQVRSKS